MVKKKKETIEQQKYLVVFNDDINSGFLFPTREEAMREIKRDLTQEENGSTEAYLIEVKNIEKYQAEIKKVN